MEYSVLQNIGNTPLVRLRALRDAADGTEIWLKVESHNPGGSVKDRVALFMIEEALKRGDIAPGGVIVEPTSGNTGIGLALVAAVRGLRCILTMPESMSRERRKLLAQFGAELVLTPATAGMAGAVRKAEELVAATPGAYMPGQFTNPDVVAAHYLHTGPEVWQGVRQAAGGPVDALVAAFGTGGTLTGTGRYLREQYPDVQLWGVEPAASPLVSQGKAGPHPIQGIGANFIPAVLDVQQLTGVLTVEGADAMATARALYAREGVSAGISSGANVWAALQLAKEPHMRGKRIVTFICDGGERYLSTDLFA